MASIFGARRSEPLTHTLNKYTFLAGERECKYIPAPLPHGECGVWGRAPSQNKGFFLIFRPVIIAVNISYW